MFRSLILSETALGQPRTLKSPSVLAGPLVQRLAAKYGRPEGTIILSWIVQRENRAAIPKSSSRDRQKANLQVSFEKSCQSRRIVDDDNVRCRSLCLRRRITTRHLGCMERGESSLSFASTSKEIGDRRRPVWVDARAVEVGDA